MKLDNSTPVIDAEADLTAFGTDGFSLNWTTNDAVQTQILYLSLSPLAVTEVRLISFTASREARGVHLAWHTGSEVSNLGFHLYREIDGRRTRITRSLVAGSGLMVGSRSRVTNDQKYSFWDLDGSAAVDTGNVLARGRGLQRQEHVARSRAAGGSRWPRREPGRQQPDAYRTGPRCRTHSRTLHDVARARDGGRSARVQPDDGRGARGHGRRRRLAQWAIANQPAVKIGVRAAGWYRVTQPVLVAAGLDPQVGSLDAASVLRGRRAAHPGHGSRRRTVQSG